MAYKIMKNLIQNSTRSKEELMNIADVYFAVGRLEQEQYMELVAEIGKKGECVKELQQRLCSLGYTVVCDGIFGDKTLAAVKAFQRANGLVVDGIVGKKTWAVVMD